MTFTSWSPKYRAKYVASTRAQAFAHVCSGERAPWRVLISRRPSEVKISLRGRAAPREESRWTLAAFEEHH